MLMNFLAADLSTMKMNDTILTNLNEYPMDELNWKNALNVGLIDIGPFF